jgi:uncharacterized membrane protein YedE/YeeE
MKSIGGTSETRYWSPFLAGGALGLTLLLTFYLTGHGLGASGAFTAATATVVEVVSPGYAEENSYLGGFVASGRSPLRSWIVFEVLGVVVGGFVGAATAGRLRIQVERGPTAGRLRRLALAFVGGGIMGFATRLARGCTSGQALSGGAAMAAGSWALMLALFAGGFLAAPFVRGQWR